MNSNVHDFDRAYVINFVNKAVKIFDERGKEAAKRFIQTKKYPERLREPIQKGLNRALNRRKR